jgi:hypothetical protein
MTKNSIFNAKIPYINTGMLLLHQQRLHSVEKDGKTLINGD